MWWKFLIGLIKKLLRIICLFLFLHWIFWITTYANCNNYRDSINKSIKEEISHDEEIDYGYQKWGKKEKKTIVQIEEEILSKIESRKKKDANSITREWKVNHLSKLTDLYQEKETLRKKQNPSEEEKDNLAKMERDYQTKLKEAKEKTIENIHKQLENNDLTISEIDDGRDWWESLKADPLKFFFISPLNKTSKELQLTKASLWGEIFFKLAVVKLLYILVIYPELNLNSLQENSTKLQDPSLSLEEKAQISTDFSPWPMIFNMVIALPLLNIFTPLHPSFVDKTNPTYFQEKNFSYLLLVIIFTGIISNISGEFVRQKRILKFKEIKTYLIKNWIVSLIVAPLLQFVFFFYFGSNYGGYLFSICSGLVEFTLNMVKVVFFRGKGGKTLSSHNSLLESFNNLETENITG